MIRQLPFQPHHLPLLDLQPLQRLWSGPDFLLDEAHGAMLQAAGPCWTVTDAAGWPLAVLGFKEEFPHYAVAWALLACRLGRHHLALTRGIARTIAASTYRRIEALIRADHPAGARWAALVGLRPVHLLRAAGADGGDFWLFERIREGADG